MKQKLFVGLLAMAVLASSMAVAGIETPWKRGVKAPDASPGAVAAQVIGKDTWITIYYHRPGVKGRNVWEGSSDNDRIGPLVPRDGKPRPWRAGANEATVIEIGADVLIEGKALAAGSYAVFMIPTDDKWTIIFHSKANQWGSFGYKGTGDALRVDVTAVEAPHQEWLIYGFDDPAANSTTAFLHWEKKKVPFKIELAGE